MPWPGRDMAAAVTPRPRSLPAAAAWGGVCGSGAGGLLSQPTGLGQEPGAAGLSQIRAWPAHQQVSFPQQGAGVCRSCVHPHPQAQARLLCGGSRPWLGPASCLAGLWSSPASQPGRACHLGSQSQPALPAALWAGTASQTPGLGFGFSLGAPLPDGSCCRDVPAPGSPLHRGCGGDGGGGGVGVPEGLVVAECGGKAQHRPSSGGPRLRLRSWPGGRGDRGGRGPWARPTPLVLSTCQERERGPFKSRAQPPPPSREIAGLRTMGSRWGAARGDCWGVSPDPRPLGTRPATRTPAHPGRGWGQCGVQGLPACRAPSSAPP